MSWASGPRAQGVPTGSGRQAERAPATHLHVLLQTLEQPLLEDAGGSREGLLQLREGSWEPGQQVGPEEGPGRVTKQQGWGTRPGMQSCRLGAMQPHSLRLQRA